MLFNKSVKSHFRRQVKRTQASVREVQDQAKVNLDRLVLRRWRKFAQVRRFVIGWIALLVVLMVGLFFQMMSLGKYYKQEVPAPGGTFTEGVVSDITNLNPIFAASPADQAASALMFDGLLRYDKSNRLVGNLASSWSIDDKQTTYTVKLRDDIYWHDGQPITSGDVRFTIDTIQHPDTRSSFNSSWRNIKVEAPDDKTVVFKLPNPFTPFLHSLTVGILPEHVLAGVAPDELRAHTYNLAPTVGSGPFVFDKLILDEDVAQIVMKKNPSYHFGAPQLDEFIIQAFTDYETMLKAFNDKEISAAAGLRPFNEDQLAPASKIQLYELPVYSNVFTFFNTSDKLLKSKDFRQALVQATDRHKIHEILNGHFPVSESPLLEDQLGYRKDMLQLAYNPGAAAKKLDKLGWKMGKDNFRHKAGQRLELSLVGQNNGEYPRVAEEIKRQWQDLGIALKVELFNPDNLQQSYTVPHSYQTLLLGVSVGVDPDQFVYWHSSQAGVGGFNFSEYKSPLVDSVLEAGRTRLDTKLRVAKYKTFLQQWRQDAPAVALYRPTFGYVQQGIAEGFLPKKLNTPADRFYDVKNWTINTKIVNKEL